MYNCNIKEVKKKIDIHISLISSLYGDSFWWKMTLCQCYVILKIRFGSADFQSNAEVYDKEQNCNNNVRDSVTRSALQTNLESGFTFQDMSPAKTSSGQYRISFFQTQMVSPMETFLMKQTELMHRRCCKRTIPIKETSHRQLLLD